MNYAGLAELGWRATQTINGKNGYDDWERLTPAEQTDLKSGWAAQSKQERDYLTTVVTAATDAFARAISV